MDGHGLVEMDCLEVVKQRHRSGCYAARQNTGLSLETFDRSNEVLALRLGQSSPVVICQLHLLFLNLIVVDSTYHSWRILTLPALQLPLKLAYALDLAMALSLVSACPESMLRWS